VGETFGVFQNPSQTVAIVHGGGAKAQGYADLLKRSLGIEVKFVATKDCSPNACLEGAAMTVLLDQ
ncbi:MAG: hypothetical protein U0946_05245, partial [Patescibacteria group bacterium]|nr:hypothetical protein [Patescibacteria group bacterium]